jgi:hypothetical protein
MPTVEPLKQTGVELILRQSKTPILPTLSSRVIISGPSGVGKGNLVAQMLLNPLFYRGCFDEILYFSASAQVDPNLNPIRKYCEEHLEQSRPCLYDTFDEQFLRDHLDEQLKLVRYTKKQAAKEGKRKVKGWQTIVIIDDFADSPEVMRKSGGILESLFIRGRHANVSVFLLTQKYRALSPVCRLNANAICFFSQRSQFDLQAFLDETSAAVPRKELEALYRRATLQDHGFLYCNLMGSVPRFFSSFEKELIPPSLQTQRRIHPQDEDES